MLRKTIIYAIVVAKSKLRLGRGSFFVRVRNIYQQLSTEMRYKLIVVIERQTFVQTFIFSVVV
ncbi:hypothetical protein DRW42_11570 [Pedobacter miscanthi]|uniref:Uncharacterized protein n=1 Tax=Pedobacter miscanthi TaxID=2259170 RepID=A0A366KZ09_9SPHI|nr:hypothetical protein DRW42_11570 [Pedobacter miscanthi]